MGKTNDSGSWNDAFIEVDPGINNDPDKIIDFSKMHQTLDDKALSENNGSQNKTIGDNGRWICILFRDFCGAFCRWDFGYFVF